MNFFAKLFLTLCIFAGFGNAVTHQYLHNSHDECADHCSPHSHSHQEDSGKHDPEAPAHHHDCCHFPSADRALGTVSLSYSFHTHLVEIVDEITLAPDELYFSLDKPPLI